MYIQVFLTIYMYIQVFLTIYIKVITESEYLIRNLFNQALKAHRVSHSCSQNIFCGLQFYRHWPHNHYAKPRVDLPQGLRLAVHKQHSFNINRSVEK